MEEGWTVSPSLNVRGFRYDEYGETELEGTIECAPVREGVWKVTVTACDGAAEFTATVSNPENGDSFETGTGIGIYTEEYLVYGSEPLDGAQNDWGFIWQDGFKASLHDTLSLKTRNSRDVTLYLLVYQWAEEDGKPAGWYCENVNINQIRAEGVSVTQAKKDSPHIIHISAQSAGDHQVIRLQEREDGEGFIENSTRGVALAVSVTASGGSSGSSSSGSSGSGTVVPNRGGYTTGSTYPISVPARLTGGTVSVQPQSAGKGAVVTVTVKPEDGYELDTLSITDADGKPVPAARTGEGRYTFTMPGSRAAVNASFRKAESQEPEPQAAEPAAEGFADVASGAYYYDAVQWAAERGVTGGTGAGRFSPGADCTRAQIVTFLYRGQEN